MMADIGKLSQDSLMTPALLNNRYRMIQALGTGGFGETFLVEDTHMPSRRYCVMKQLKPLTSKPEVTQLIQERFQREAAILEQLGEGSEQVPRLYAYFAEEGKFYLVQEWVEGLTLNQKLQRDGLLDENAVTALLVSILPVLEYIHGEGIIHRDIKPSNIILRQRDEQPVLIDFGIAKEMMSTEVNSQGEITSSIAVGTKGFMPPEQAAGKPVYASDIYSLGLTAIYLLTGKLPQELKTNLETGELIWRTGDLDISSSFAAVIDKAVQSYPGDRFPTARDMLQALQPRDSRRDSTVSERYANRLVSRLPDTFSPSQATTTLAVEPETIKFPPTNQEIFDAKTHYTPQEYRNRNILLNKVKNYWIKGVLETSLHGRALISLGLEKRLDAIARPWGIVWETPDQTRKTLPANTRIIDQFDQMGAGRTLLILGDPGAGKTTTLLELTRDLIERAEQDVSQSIPVVFNLSCWVNDKQTLADWLVQELNNKYQVCKEIGRAWLENEQLLLLLDGFDEINIKRRDLCVQVINQFIQTHGSTEIVVTSRTQDYEILSHRLKFQGALFIQPLTLEQIHQYLLRAGPELTSVNAALQGDTTLQELAKSPLMLSIITLAYQGMSVTDFPGMNIDERRQHLFDKYIQRMFDRRGGHGKYSQKQAIYWLSWLAKRLSQESLTVFLIERMQPNWLQSKWQKRLYILGTILSFALLGGLVGCTVLPPEKLILALIIGGFFFGFVFDLNRITPVATSKWSWQHARKNMVLGLIFGPILGLAIKIVYELLFNPVHWGLFSPGSMPLTLFSLLRGAIFGLSLGLVFGLIRGFTGPNIKTGVVPNQRMWHSAKNAVVFGTIGALVLGIAARLLHWPTSFWGTFGLSFGLATGGGEACIKHLILRLILYWKGYIPWNYARFLDYAAERIFLQKVGGGYIFVHRLLLEHFAQMDLKP